MDFVHGLPATGKNIGVLTVVDTFRGGAPIRRGARAQNSYSVKRVRVTILFVYFEVDRFRGSDQFGCCGLHTFYGCSGLEAGFTFQR